MSEIKKILIVDDEEQSRLYLASIVNELYPEFSIQLAATPAEALFLLNKEYLDIVFLDVEMPGMNGLEMLEKLREINANLPVIFVSGYKRAEFIQKAMRLGAVDYIDKPVDPIELDAALQKILQLKIVFPSTKATERFCLFTNSGDMFLEVDEILYFSSDKRYSTAYLKDGSSKTIRDNLETLTKKLPAQHFLRVSRQYIVNTNVIKFVSKANKTITIQSGGKNLILYRIYPNVISELIEEFSL